MIRNRLILALFLVLGLVTGRAGAGPSGQLVILNAMVVGTAVTITGLNLGGGTPPHRGRWHERQRWQ